MCSCWHRGTKWLFVLTSFCKKFTNLLFELPKLQRRAAKSVRSRMMMARTTIRLAPFDWRLRTNGDSMRFQRNTYEVIPDRRRLIFGLCLKWRPQTHEHPRFPFRSATSLGTLK